MEIHADLHAHSAFAGGARAGGTDEKKIRRRFIDSAHYSPLKGVNLIGTGDCQFDPWTGFLSKNLEEVENGIYEYSGDTGQNSSIPHDLSKPKYILQTELIFTGPLPDSKKRKRVHIIILFPDFDSISELNALLDKWGVSRKNMARPYVVCQTRDEVDNKIQEIMDIHPMIEMIPAHVLTPEGVYGGNNRINFMYDFFGDAHTRFNAIKTGLSADPTILGMISELDRYTLISNADAHSASLNRVGREFTTYRMNNMDYTSLIDSLRRNRVVKTAEFHPTEGRYFLTGHRDMRKMPGIHAKHQFCYFSPKHVPVEDICPQCGKELTVGVLQRATEIGIAQGEPRNIGDGPKRDFVTMVPLIEIIAHYMGIKSITSKKIKRVYADVLDYTGTEVNLWIDQTIDDRLKDSKLPEKLVEQILEVKRGNFSFFPGGYDGTYGVLRIGEQIDFKDINVVQG